MAVIGQVHMSPEHRKMDELLGQLKLKVSEVLSRYSEESAKMLLEDLLNCLIKASETHYQLVRVEEGERFRLQESDYHEILDSYLPVLRLFTTLRKSYPKSVYEIAVVCTFDEVLVHHCEGQQ